MFKKLLAKISFVVISLFILLPVYARGAELNYKMPFSNIRVTYDSNLLIYSFEDLLFSKNYNFSNGIQKISFDEKGNLWIATFAKEVFCFCYNDYENDLTETIKNESKRLIKKDIFTVGTFITLNLYLYYFDTLTDIPVELSNIEPVIVQEPTSVPILDQLVSVPSVTKTDADTPTPTSYVVQNNSQVASNTPAVVATTAPVSLTTEDVIALIKANSPTTSVVTSTQTPTATPTSTATATKNKTKAKTKTKTKTKTKVKTTTDQKKKKYDNYSFSDNVKYNKDKKTLTFTRTKKEVLKNVDEFGYTKKGTLVFRKNNSLYRIKNNKIKLHKKNIIAFIYDFEDDYVSKYVTKVNGNNKAVLINF